MITADQLKEDFFSLLRLWIEQTYPDQEEVLQAVRYSLSGAGKLIRPSLCFLTAEMLLPGCWKRAVAPAISLELIHTYSLIHDDLPTMDNDDWRRGRLSCHKAFSEATALLAGDGLLADGFRVLSDLSFCPHSELLSGEQRLQALNHLAAAASTWGMVLGQNLDMLLTGNPERCSLEQLERLHRLKTGKLLGAACAMGAIAADATRDEVRMMRDFGETIGLAFQITDDVLDEYPDTGKTQGKDLAQNKLTFLSFMSAGDAKKLAQRYTKGVIDALPKGSYDTRNLIDFVLGLLERRC